MISRWGVIPSTFALVNPLKADDHRYVISQRFRGEPRKVVPLRGGHSPLLHLGNPLKANEHRYVIPQRFRCEPRKAVALLDLKQKNDTS